MKVQRIDINENLILYYENGRLCYVKKPLDKIEIEFSKNRNKFWYLNGKLHRDKDLPAIECANVSREWWLNGQRHRGGGLPAVKLPNGSCEWWLHGKLHRDNDSPAIECADGYREWYKNGQFIREEKG